MVAADQRRRLEFEVNSMDEGMLLNTPIHELCNYLAAKYRTSIPILKTDQILIEQQEAQVAVPIPPASIGADGRQSRIVAGSIVKVSVPFEGDPACFHMQPTTFTFHPPLGDVEGDFVIFQLEGVGLVADMVRVKIQQIVIDIGQNLKYLQTDTNRFNGNLYSYANLLVDQQRKKVLSDPDTAGATGFKLKDRGTDAPNPASPPTDPGATARRTLTPVLTLPKQSKLIPTLALKDYEQILQALQNSTQVLRRSPSVLKVMDAAALRAYFLIQLNDRFEDKSGIETFGFAGKSDIRIRTEDKNIFVAECIVWAGPAAFITTLNQLLAYENWREVKAAIIVFARDRAELDNSFADVLDALRVATRNHSSFKRELPQLSDTIFLYGFAPLDEPQREILLTVLTVDVP